MTVFEFHPRFTNEDDWACRSVDDRSPWCLAISDCIWNYMFRFYEIECEVKTCEWPLTEHEFNFNKKSKFYRESVKDFNTYEEYLASYPKVKYDTYIDNQFYGLKNTDGTCDFAYQDNEHVFIIHIHNGSYRTNCKHDEGFGCVINKLTNDIHCVELEEDDGNYWGDHDIPLEKLEDWEWMYVTQIINEMKEEQFTNKETLIEKIFNLSKNK